MRNILKLASIALATAMLSLSTTRAAPVTYAVDGVQYLAVAAGGNAIFGFKQGGALIVFALPKRP